MQNCHQPNIIVKEYEQYKKLILRKKEKKNTREQY